MLPAEAYVGASGRTMVPLRFVSESLGFTVTWEAKTRQVTIRGAGREVSLRIGQSRAVVDGREKRLDTVPVIYRNRTMVPLRFVAETFGLEVDWEGSTRTVLLSRPKEDPSRPAWVEVTAEVVNIRTGPGTDYARKTQVQRGTRLPTLAYRNGWYEVALPSGGRGWIAGWLVRETTAPPESEGKRRVAIVTEAVVNLRAGPGTDYPLVGQVRRYQQLDIVGQEGAWYRVVCAGREAWIAGWLVAVRVLDAAARSPEPGEERPSVPGEAEQEGPPPGTPPVTVSAVEAGVEGEELVLKVHTGGRVWWRPGRLYEPLRLYLDLTPAVLAPQLAAFEQPFETGPALRLRLGQFNEGTARLVLDLRQPGINWKAISFEEEPSVLSLRVGLPDLREKTVVLDPGHGSLQRWGDSDPGAIGPSGVKEREVVLAVAQEAGRLLEEKGAKVVFTRTGNATTLDLYQRADLANSEGAQVFVSIHANASPSPAVGGTSTYYCVPPDLPGQREARRRLAFCLQRALVARLGLEDKGVRQANFAVLRATAMPSVLLELAYLSNPAEEALLADPAFQQRAALAIVEGLLDFFAQE